jgi:glucokinase
MRKYILGIDVGGTKIAAGLVDRKFQVTKVRIVPTSQTNLIGQLVKLIEFYDGFGAIGLGMPGWVLPNGVVTNLPNVKNFQKTNVRVLLEKKFKIPVKVMNDARAFTLAEATLGAGEKFKTVVGVTLGTGIGGGVVIDKKLYSGRNLMSGEWGHIFIRGDQTLEQTMQKFGKFTDAKQVEALAHVIMSVIVRSVDPEIIIFGGSRSTLPGLQTILNRSLKLVYQDPLKTIVKVSKLKHAGIIGAVLPLITRA